MISSWPFFQAQKLAWCLRQMCRTLWQVLASWIQIEILGLATRNATDHCDHGEHDFFVVEYPPRFSTKSNVKVLMLPATENIIDDPVYYKLVILPLWLLYEVHYNRRICGSPKKHLWLAYFPKGGHRLPRLMLREEYEFLQSSIPKPPNSHLWNARSNASFRKMCR